MDLPAGPWEALQAWQTHVVIALAEHIYQGELYEAEGGIYRSKMNTKKRLTSSSFIQYSPVLWILCFLSCFPKALY